MLTNAPQPLRFRADGGFTVLQISDVQDGRGLYGRSRRLLEAALDQEKPDFVVFTGDQIKGYGAAFWTGSRAQKERRCARVINAILEPLEARGVPFTFVFGNHDHDAPMDGGEQIRIYQKSGLCHAVDTPDVPGYANHTVQVYPVEGAKPLLNFYLLDSHGSKGVGYQPLDMAQVEWYRATRDALRAAYGDFVPSLLFQHIPVEEIIRLYKKVPRRAKGAMEGYRIHRGAHYVLDKEKVAPGSFAGELPSCPDYNAGLFAVAKEKGDMMGMFFGHDHSNGFHGKVEGMDLGYAPSAGFTAYGAGRKRGVRVFRFRQEDVRAYETYVATDEMLLGPEAKPPLHLHIVDRVPSSFGAAKPLVRRSVIAASLTGLGIVAYSQIHRNRRFRAFLRSHL
ncbi:MAG: metallophosphoesterase family protein [Oscillospiraceae bacterium]|jgi:hypothetical protein|nr:metallophosphoesterase family protein [Oscillospiraceae bacterium]